MASGVEATVREAPPLMVIDLRGEVTTFAEEAITSAYRQACERGAERVLLNFAGVDYINSAGISVIIGLLTDARKTDRQIMVMGLTPHYKKIFQMMGLAQFARLFDSEDEARQAAT